MLGVEEYQVGDGKDVKIILQISRSERSLAREDQR